MMHIHQNTARGENMNKFWVIWKDGGGVPTFRHVKQDSVRAEAERLARQFPGQIFHVLECIDSCRTNDVIWESERNSAVPF